MIIRHAKYLVQRRLEWKRYNWVYQNLVVMEIILAWINNLRYDIKMYLEYQFRVIGQFHQTVSWITSFLDISTYAILYSTKRNPKVCYIRRNKISPSHRHNGYFAETRGCIYQIPISASKRHRLIWFCRPKVCCHARAEGNDENYL